MKHVFFFLITTLMVGCNAEFKTTSELALDKDVLNSSIVGTTDILANGAATSIVTITLRNELNAPIVGVIPTFSATDTQNTNIYGSCSHSNFLGVSTCSMSSSYPEIKTLSITSPVFKNGSTVRFLGLTPFAANSTIEGTGPVTADGVANSSVTITLLDASGFPVVGRVPTFSATNTGSDNAYGICTATDNSGVSICSLSSATAETKNLSIVSPVTKIGGAVVFASSAVSAVNSTIVGTGPVTADGITTSVVTITLRDASNNPVSGQTPSFTATNSGSTNSYSACSVSNASGVSTCTLASLTPETKVLSIASPVAKAGGSVTFVVGSVSSINTTITGSGPVLADGSAVSIITITMLDGSGNPVSGQVPTFSATNTSSANIYGPCSSSNASGVSTCTLASARAETKTLSVATPVSKVGGSVIFTAGAPSSITSTISGTGSVVADGSATSTVTITLLDANSNPVVGTVPTFGATNTGSLNSYGACSATNASGVSTCTLASTKAETKTLAISSPVAKTGGNVVFTVGSASATTSTITGTGSVLADGTDTSTVTITLLDASSNPVVGTVPTFGATNTGSLNIYGTCSATNASGVSTCTLASTKAETKTLSLVSPIAKTGGTVVFTAGAVSATTSTITGTGSVLANGTATSTVTITLKDANNNLVSGTIPTFGATNTGTTNTYGTCSTSDASGISTCTLASTKAETKTLSIVSPVAKVGGTVVFTAGAADATYTTISGTTPVLANGVAFSIVTITLKDANQNPIAGSTPIFNATNTGTVNSYGACAASNASGVSVCSLSSTKAESKVLQLTSPTAVTGTTVVFTAGSADSSKSVLTATSPVVANFSDLSTVTITLKDTYDNFVSGVVPTFSATGINNTLNACSASNASGVSTCTMKSWRAESKSLNISSPFVKVTSPATVVFDPGPASGTFTTVVASGPVVADGVATSTIVMKLIDVYGNQITAGTPTFDATGTGNSYGTCVYDFGVVGHVCSMTSTVAESKLLRLLTPVFMSGTWPVEFVVDSNIAPKLVLEDKVIVLNYAQEFFIKAIDPDFTDTLEYSIKSTSFGFESSGIQVYPNGRITIPRGAARGDYTLDVEVNDTRGGVDSGSFLLSIVDPGGRINEISLLDNGNTLCSSTTESEGLCGYVEYVPDAYSASSANMCAVISLHGNNGQGDGSLANLARVYETGSQIQLALSGKSYPCLLFAPQSDSAWSAEQAERYLTYFKKNYRIDLDRIYFVGEGQGANGVSAVMNEWGHIVAGVALSFGSNYSHSGKYPGSKLHSLNFLNTNQWHYHMDRALGADTMFNYFRSPMEDIIGESRDMSSAFGGTDISIQIPFLDNKIVTEDGFAPDTKSAANFILIKSDDSSTEGFDFFNINELDNWLFGQSLDSGIRVDSLQAKPSVITQNGQDKINIGALIKDLNGLVIKATVNLDHLGGGLVDLVEDSPYTYSASFTAPAGLNEGAYPAFLNVIDDRGNLYTKILTIDVVNDGAKSGDIISTVQVNFGHKKSVCNEDSTDWNPILSETSNPKDYYFFARHHKQIPLQTKGSVPTTTYLEFDYQAIDDESDRDNDGIQGTAEDGDAKPALAFPDKVLKCYWYTQSLDKTYDSTTRNLKFKIGGLNPKLYYSLSVIGAVDSDKTKDSIFTLTGLNESSENRPSENGVDITERIAKMGDFPDQHGNIYLRVDESDAKDPGSKGYINAFILEARIP